jgi:hypothetical protein
MSLLPKEYTQNNLHSIPFYVRVELFAILSQIFAILGTPITVSV